ncbi:hypothetical protein M404DRAFT_27096 [Pisolithus tinctorius Marx 270]|uniref:Uncharacterized protein n=1 Tax=Pisolithus tinctorius Marx 270 TaxID=870435 RepID=A0A0C3P788_PISTI|nr:hypothetical protein M404DRAFT_27096 [Pisolithus tinctorius Marx 270]
MDVDRPHHRDFSGPSRDSVGRGPAGHPCLLLHHPVPQQQLSTEELRSSANQDLAQHSEYFNRPLHVPSGSASPAPHPTYPRSPVSTFPAYPPPSRQPIEPAQPSIPASQHTPPSYPRELRAADRDMAWDRRGPHPEHHRDWEDRNHRGRSEYPTHPSQQPYYASRSPGPCRALSPMETSPHSAHHSRPHWDSKPPSGPSTFGSSQKRALALRSRQIRRVRTSGGARRGVEKALEFSCQLTRGKPSSADSKNRRKQPQLAKDKDSDTQSIGGSIPSDAPKRKKRQRRAKDDSGLPANLPASFKPSPTSATPRLLSRVVDEDYDEGVADALVNLSQTRPAEQSASAHDNYNATRHSPTLSNASRHTINSLRDAAPHRRSTSSSNGPSPASSGASSLKRLLSPTTEEADRSVYPMLHYSN